MKKLNKILLTILTLILFLNNVDAITPSNTVSDDLKLGIFGGYISNGKINKINDLSHSISIYSDVGKYYNTYITTTNENTGEEYISRSVYTNDVYATDACAEYISRDENKDKDYLCTGTTETNAYACVVDGVVNLLSKDEQRLYIDVDTDYGDMFNTRSECETACSAYHGTCEFRSGYSYKYTKNVEQEAANGNFADVFADVRGQYFVTKNNEPAFCIQPDKDFPGYTTTAGANYCLDQTFDLTTCNSEDGYNSDYRCGLAYILLKGACIDEQAKDKNASCTNVSLSLNEYKIIDVAMRMWASYVGNLRGTTGTGLPTSSSDITVNGKPQKIYYFGLTAKRTAQDSNYLKNGLACAKDSKNIGIMCTQDHTLYKQSLTLFDSALKAKRVDEKGNPVPVMLTKNITNETEGVVIKLPCDPTEDDNCEITIVVTDQNGNVVSKDDPKCDKNNTCTQRIDATKTCTTTGGYSYKATVTIKNFILGGRVRSYYYCNQPNDYQIMYVLDATGKEVTEPWTKEYTIESDCVPSCDPSKLQKTITSYNETDTNSKNDNINSCDDYKSNDKIEYNEEDYDGYDTIVIADPPMSEILNDPDCATKFLKNNYTTGDTEKYCKIYCREETVVKLADKKQVYSGMQFKYELENLIGNSGRSDGNHISSIVTTKNECASVIDYDKWNKDYQQALTNMVNAWTNWKGWYELFKHYQDVNPRYLIWDVGCSATCDAYKSDDDTRDIVCKGIANKITAKNKGELTYDGLLKETKKIDAENSKAMGIPGVCMPKSTFKLYWDAYDSKKGCLYTGEDVKCGQSISRELDDGTWPVSGNVCEIYAPNMEWSYEKGYCDFSDQSSCGCEVSWSKKLFGTGQINGESINDCKNKVSEQKKSKYLPDDTSSCSGSDCNCKCLVTNTPCPPNLTKCSTCYSGSVTKFGDLDTSKIDPNNCDYQVSTESCSEGVNGDPDKLYFTMEGAKGDYLASLQVVSDLLTKLENCELYIDGNWIPGDPEFQEYSVALNDGVSYTPIGPNSHSTGGGGGGTGGGGGGTGGGGTTGGGDIIYIPKVSSPLYDENGNLIKYNSENMISNNSKYITLQLGTATGLDVLKRNIINKYATSINGNGIMLDVQYDSGSGINKGYGESLTYSKVSNIIDDSSELDCDNEQCSIYTYYNVNNNLHKGIDDLSDYVPSVWCDADHCETCNGKNCPEGIPKVVQLNSYTDGQLNGNYASFKVSLETMYYRNVDYFTESYTGKVKALNAKADKSKYIPLGKNVYPVEDAPTGEYDIKYTFTGMPNGTFKNLNGGGNYTIRDSSFEYSCSFDILNHSTNEVCYPDEPIPIDDTVPIIDEDCPDRHPLEKGFMFRNIELDDIFPNDNREIGNNWQDSSVISKIESSADHIYSSTPDLSVTLTPESIKKIKEFNNNKESGVGGYQNNSLSNCKIKEKEVEITDNDNNKTKISTEKTFTNCRSSFISEINLSDNPFGVVVNSINRSIR